MEIAREAMASSSIRDLPPSKRFKYVGSEFHLGSEPCLLPAKKRACPPLPEAAVAIPVCLPAKKRAYPLPPVDEAGTPPVCLPAKKRAYARPVDALVPACLPAKKRMSTAAAPLGTYASPCVPAEKRVFALPPPPVNAAASPCIPAEKRVFELPPPPVNAAASLCIPAEKRIFALPPPPVNAAASLCIPAKERVHAPPSPDGAAASVSVCLPTNKRVMPPFLPPLPLPSMEPDGERVPVVRKARSQGSKKPRGASNAKESEEIEHRKSCSVVNAKQSEAEAEAEVEVAKKSDEASDPEAAAARGDEAAGKPEQEAVAAAAATAEEDDDGVLCAVCGSTDGDPSDPIVFCDGCDLMVHASCYGDPLAQSIPDGDWFCSLCLRSSAGGKAKKGKPRCCLCPARGGAMKRTTDGRWAHIACALFVPEVYFRDPDGRAGIDCSGVPGHRFAKDCYVCGSSRGCALDCSQPKCGLGFHVSCALDAGLCIEYQDHAKSGAVVAGFCLEHTKLWEKQQLTGKYKIVSRGQK